ncbi:hypothetical protein SporoP37_04745 [Sporosarcina sp. P37]|uniref:hypothetical protein n=1 Tax=unclassified Sporosarcina TaxID=2647733 RepID=UPI000A17D25B|nr:MULTISPECIES: hypothetical protein [unclassified Sporosarcina]ARK24057.1 hypothetical protein SporoP37_04745 [Sporosarcina sp. P37]PID18552.1 hypothetical protein CSV62_07840 [Sporosarcina sp. P35]
MAISRKDYLQKIIRLHERLIIASEEYEGISEEFIEKQELDIPAMKEQWLVKVEEFKQILADMNALEIPNAFQTEGKELQEAYATFVSCVEEKTEKFSVEAMENGVLDALQSKEMHAAEDMEELIESMFEK